MDQEDIGTAGPPHTHGRKRHRRMDLGHDDQRFCPELPGRYVTFGLNVRLDLSREATTESLRTLSTKLLFEILGEGARTMTVWVIRGDEGAGAFPGVRGGSGESSEVLRNIARLSQELRLKV